jgi:hypothetical protein
VEFAFFLPFVLLALGFIRAVPPFIWVTVDITARSGHGVINDLELLLGVQTYLL